MTVRHEQPWRQTGSTQQQMSLRFSPLPVGFVQPCLPSGSKAPPSGKEWLHEIKHDGFRVIAPKSRRTRKALQPPGKRPDQTLSVDCPGSGEAASLDQTLRPSEIARRRYSQWSSALRRYGELYNALWCSRADLRGSRVL